MLALIDNSVTLLPALKQCLDSANGHLPVSSAFPVEDVRLQAPIPRPRKNIFGIGLNYRAHVAESAKSLDTDKDLPKQPVCSRSRRPA
jgi:2-keto-4-pentenoate hydratase/2-oxohepta-3-ene-1,7-dioic acid hydratase in catechol pathway